MEVLKPITVSGRELILLTLVEGLPYTFWYICYQKTIKDVVPSSRNSLFSGENKHVKKTLKILRRNKQKAR